MQLLQERSGSPSHGRLIKNEDPNFMSYIPTTNHVQSQDRDSEVMRESLAAESISRVACPISGLATKNLEDKVVDDGLGSQAVVESKARNVILDVLSAHKNQVSSRVPIQSQSSSSG